ncbi:hypothetical protein A3Q56_07368 [Intoshia linei]|uniref:Uncharacterized protein n=1 Tax=Intoshia linei TaxID=1819745 RepID=A0A177ATT7_9BILA|nr:hypothetical protein A3Q56_07368 [Intoshia linei]
MENLQNELLEKFNGNFTIQKKIIVAGSKCEYQLKMGNKPIFHIEAFVISSMYIINSNTAILN